VEAIHITQITTVLDHGIDENGERRIVAEHMEVSHRELPEPLDASDALAVALCHLHRAKASV